MDGIGDELDSLFRGDLRNRSSLSPLSEFVDND
jgi:hypothetical protein